MAVYRCKRCKSVIEFEAGATETVCKMCGKKQKLPRLDDGQASKLRRRIIIIASLAVTICVAFVIVLFNVIIPSVKYNGAVALYEAGEYDEAIAAFRALRGYRDSYAQIRKCESAKREIKYTEAVALFKAEKYEEALTIFASLSGYRDSDAYVAEYEDFVKELRYNNSVASINAGVSEENVVEVYETLAGLNGYKDSAEKAKEIFGLYKKVKLKVADVGDTVYFGAYEQDNDFSNGKENIEWLVLDKKDGGVLVISKYALDSNRFNESREDVTWEMCTLRKWLNGTFLNETFDKDEQDMIANSTVKADKNPTFDTAPGNDTTDKLFLLSVPEVNEYFKTSEDRMCRPTQYAIEQGVGVGDSYMTYGKVLCWWALRTPGYYPYYVSFVYYSGYVNHYGYEVTVHSDAIRPAMWINTEA